MLYDGIAKLRLLKACGRFASAPFPVGAGGGVCFFLFNLHSFLKDSAFTQLS